MNELAGYGATINGKHTYKDYGLVINNTSTVEEPSPKTNFVDVPGSSTRLDLTETLTGEVEYNSRLVSFTLGKLLESTKWPILYRDLLNTYQGKEVKVILDDEPEYYYQGRAELSDFSRSQMLGSFKFTLDADAYKYEVYDSTEDWAWDSFNFETGVLREDYSDIAVSSSANKFIEGSLIPVVPVFIVSDLDTTSNAHITCNGKQYVLSEGRNRFAEIKIPTTGLRVYFYGTFTVTIEFRGGSL